jgi:hypothetical protein
LSIAFSGLILQRFSGGLHVQANSFACFEKLLPEVKFLIPICRVQLIGKVRAASLPARRMAAEIIFSSRSLRHLSFSAHGETAAIQYLD